MLEAKKQHYKRREENSHNYKSGVEIFKTSLNTLKTSTYFKFVFSLWISPSTQWKLTRLLNPYTILRILFRNQLIWLSRETWKPTCFCPYIASTKLLEWKAKDKAFFCLFRQEKLIAPTEMKTLYWNRNQCKMLFSPVPTCGEWRFGSKLELTLNKSQRQIPGPFLIRKWMVC